jgi:hypothetical protein
MSQQAKDGAWVSAVRVVRVDCSNCGYGVIVSASPLSDREMSEKVQDHLRTHGGEVR